MGGTSGLACSFDGFEELVDDPDARVVHAVLSHPGGWSPFSSSGGGWLALPAITTNLTIGPGSYIHSVFTVQYQEPLTLYPDSIYMVGHPNSAAPGVMLRIALAREASAGLFGGIDFTIEAEGGLQLMTGAAEGGLPILAMTGQLSSTETSYLALDGPAFTPMPVSLPWFTLPSLIGEIAIGINGTLFVNASTNYPRLAVFDDLLIFSDLRGSSAISYRYHSKRWRRYRSLHAAS
jgi:hypothetical protein